MVDDTCDELESITEGEALGPTNIVTNESRIKLSALFQLAWDRLEKEGDDQRQVMAKGRQPVKKNSFEKYKRCEDELVKNKQMIESTNTVVGPDLLVSGFESAASTEC